MSNIQFNVARHEAAKNGATIHIFAEEFWKSFQQLVQRGANLWPDAPPEIKEFADLVTNGQVMQDYYKQAAAGVLVDQR